MTCNTYIWVTIQQYSVAKVDFRGATAPKKQRQCDDKESLDSCDLAALETDAARTEATVTAHY